MQITKKCKDCSRQFIPALRENGQIQEHLDRKHCFDCIRPLNPYFFLVSRREYEKFLGIEEIVRPEKLKTALPRLKLKPKESINKNAQKSHAIILDSPVKPVKPVKPIKTHKICPKCQTNLPRTPEFFSISKNYGKPSAYCRGCSKELSKIERMEKRKVKQKALDYKGGKCSRCGYNKCSYALEFHHTNPKEKEIGIAQYPKFDERLILELDKCELVCANCHREIHYNLRNPSDSNFDESKSPL